MLEGSTLPEIASLGTTEQAEEFDHAVPCFCAPRDHVDG
jgi:hypothetical protein